MQGDGNLVLRGLKYGSWSSGSVVSPVLNECQERPSANKSSSPQLTAESTGSMEESPYFSSKILRPKMGLGL
jgi:hypothetical protein